MGVKMMHVMGTKPGMLRGTKTGSQPSPSRRSLSTRRSRAPAEPRNARSLHPNSAVTYALCLALMACPCSGSRALSPSRALSGCRPVAGLGLAAGSLHLEIQSAMFNAPGFGRHARNPNAPRGLRAPSGYRARALPPAIGLCLGPGRSRALSMSRSRACPGSRARARFARLSCGRPMPRARGGGEGRGWCA
jgi:hypothetical protein